MANAKGDANMLNVGRASAPSGCIHERIIHLSADSAEDSVPITNQVPMIIADSEPFVHFPSDVDGVVDPPSPSAQDGTEPASIGVLRPPVH